jgi:hypothetical protein
MGYESDQRIPNLQRNPVTDQQSDFLVQIANFTFDGKVLLARDRDFPLHFVKLLFFKKTKRRLRKRVDWAGKRSSYELPFYQHSHDLVSGPLG